MKTKMQLWNEIYKAADQYELLHDRFYHFTMSAEEEANQMAFDGAFEVESEEYVEYCFRHLESSLSYTNDAKAIAFFTGLGVRF